MRHRWPTLILGLFLSFLFFPFLQLLLARTLLADAQFQVGMVFASLMPVAMVAPFFTGLLGGDEEAAFLVMVLSMLLAPLTAPLLLSQLTAGIVPIPVAPFMKSMLLLVTVPLLVSFVVCRALPRVRAAIVPHLALGNMAALSVLIFILFGTIAGRVNIGYESRAEIGLLLLLAFVQDFGVYFAARLLLAWMLPAREACALTVALSMKNVAIAAGILLFYDPRAALAPALVFVAHACLFSFLPGLKRLLAVRPERQ
jgi:predicted Na+-dependent transporter